MSGFLHHLLLPIFFSNVFAQAIIPREGNLNVFDLSEVFAKDLMITIAFSIGSALSLFALVMYITEYIVVCRYEKMVSQTKLDAESYNVLVNKEVTAITKSKEKTQATKRSGEKTGVSSAEHTTKKSGESDQKEQKEQKKEQKEQKEPKESKKAKVKSIERVASAEGKNECLTTAPSSHRVPTQPILNRKKPSVQVSARKAAKDEKVEQLEVASFKPPRATKGHHEDKLDNMEKIMLEESDDESSVSSKLKGKEKIGEKKKDKERKKKSADSGEAKKEKFSRKERNDNTLADIESISKMQGISVVTTTAEKEDQKSDKPKK